MVTVGDKGTTINKNFLAPMVVTTGDKILTFKDRVLRSGEAYPGDKVTIITKGDKKYAIKPFTIPTGCYWLEVVDSYSIGTGGTEEATDNCLGNHVTQPLSGPDDAHTLLGDEGWVIADWPIEVDFESETSYYLSIWTRLTGYPESWGAKITLGYGGPNPLSYIEPTRLFWWPGPDTEYYISFILPNQVRIAVKNTGGGSGEDALGQIVGARFCYI